MLLIVMYVFLTEVFGITLTEDLVEMFSCEDELFCSCYDNGEIG